jgi:hypothetical protein
MIALQDAPAMSNVIVDRRQGGKTAGDRRKAELARRRWPRMRTLKGAKIVVPAGGSARVTVRDISEMGARLELQGPAFLAQTFQIVFDDPDWAPRPCRVAWREGLILGVEFESPEPEDGPIRRALRRLLSRRPG